VRIRPQNYPDEPVERLIEDPWLQLNCPEESEECVVEFTDEEYRSHQRDTVYYVRALQEPTPAINGNNLRTEFNEDGSARSVKPCYGDYRTSFDDNCLGDAQERAWSSPIYVDWN
jgi:hypothetical protein